MTKAIIKSWLDAIHNADDESDNFYNDMDALMAQAATFCTEPGIDMDLYVDLCNIQWLWKHLAHTEYDVGSGSDNPCDVLYIIWEITDKMLGRIDGFYNFN